MGLSYSSLWLNSGTRMAVSLPGQSHVGRYCRHKQIAEASRAGGAGSRGQAGDMANETL